MTKIHRARWTHAALRAFTLGAVAAPALLLAVALPAHADAAPLHAAAVASPDLYGARAAREILQAGGNAVDAAVATAFALAVTYPEAGNIGGGGFMTLRIDGKSYFLDYRETAPAAARADMYLDGKGNVIAGLSEVGVLASGVPGTVRGLAEAHRRFGKLTWQQDLAPAIRFAREGFVVDRQFYDLKDANQSPFLTSTNFQRYFGHVEAGKAFRQPELARTLERIAKAGPDEFYTGRTARLLVAQMARGKPRGIVTLADLAGYKPVWREPLVGTWGDFTVVTAPPPSSGGIALLQLLGMKRARADLFAGVPLNSDQYVHLVSEIEKRVFADRAEYLGDPDFVAVPAARLVDPGYLARRAAELDPVKPSALAAVNPGLEKPQTTHFSIVDHDGNAVANTYTLNGWFGAGVVVEGAGFLLNDEMDDFSAKPGAPNMYGVVGSSANAIAPGRRPLSSMVPSILLRDGQVALVLGSPGGSRIFTSVFQVVADVYDYGLTLEEAQHSFRFHHQLLPVDTIYSEPYLPIPKPLRAQLEQRGYTIADQDWNGDVEAVRVEGGWPIAGPDPRARGVGMVVP